MTEGGECIFAVLFLEVMSMVVMVVTSAMMMSVVVVVVVKMTVSVARL